MPIASTDIRTTTTFTDGTVTVVKETRFTDLPGEDQDRTTTDISFKLRQGPTVRLDPAEAVALVNLLTEALA